MVELPWRAGVIHGTPSGLPALLCGSDCSAWLVLNPVTYPLWLSCSACPLRWSASCVARWTGAPSRLNLSRWLCEVWQDLFEILPVARVHEIGHSELRLSGHARVDLTDV